MSITIDPKKILSKLDSLSTAIYNKVKTEKVLGVYTCSPLFKDSVKFSNLQKLEKETSKKNDLDEITYQKKKILKKYSDLQLDQMEKIIRHLEKEEQGGFW